MKINASNPLSAPDPNRLSAPRKESPAAETTSRQLPADTISLTAIALNSSSGAPDRIATAKALVNSPDYSPDTAALAKTLIKGAITNS